MMTAMTVETRRPPYAGWRAAAATVLVMPGAVIAHTWAGGHLPGLPVLLLMGGTLYAGSLALLRGRLPASALLSAVAVAQVALHASFVASAPAPADMHLTAHAPHAMASPWSGRMLVAHAAVTVLTAVVWRLCERAVGTASAVVGLLAPYASGRRDPRPFLGSAPVPVRRIHLLLGPRRGPPVARRHA